MSEAEREEALRLLPDAWGKLRANFSNSANLEAFENVFFAYLDRLARQSAPIADSGPRKIGGPFLPAEVARNAKCAAEGKPLLYLCPAGCGCTWRDNEDGTMSLGLYQRSCEVCETLPLDKLVPLYMRQSAPQAEPVAWRKTGADGTPMYLTVIPINDPTAMIDGGWEALYLCASPPAQPDADVVRDALRYRWLCDLANEASPVWRTIQEIGTGKKEIDAAIDAALQSAKPEGKS